MHPNVIISPVRAPKSEQVRRTQTLTYLASRFSLAGWMTGWLTARAAHCKIDRRYEVDPPQVARKGYEEARVLACQRRPLEGILSPSPPNTLPQPLGKRGGVGRIDITVTYVDPAREACRHPFQETAWSRGGERWGGERDAEGQELARRTLSAVATSEDFSDKSG
ncbi:hypothetical protein C0Q70_02617 [Pomacea canaliculata]|uniref:Uncharacterized protein n=1 Tax=Pomacea canaliculata TaxID=400727 RepID=A0A2T7PQF6_POMCA|nr:hypothetical protein C0Q70_02617 [Pomacea canaliculata]